MSDMTSLVRRATIEVLAPRVGGPLARAISTKLAGDPRLDRYELTTSAIEPGVYIVAEATYRIDFSEFGVDDVEATRTDIVTRVTELLAESVDEDPSAFVTGEEPDTELIEDIIVAESSESTYLQTAYDTDNHDSTEDVIVPDPR